MPSPFREETGKKNKSEEFREMLRAARGFGKPDASGQKRADEEGTPVHSAQPHPNEENKEGPQKRFPFLKRTSKNPGFQKVEC